MNEKKYSLIEVLKVLKKTYNSIDIRGIFAFSSDERIWRCIFLKISLTKETIRELNEIYRLKKETLSEINFSDFKVILEAKKIEELNNLFECLDSMHIRIGDIRDSQPLGVNYQYFNNNNSFVTKDYKFRPQYPSENTEYERIAWYSFTNRTINDSLSHCKVNISNYNIPITILSSYLDIDGFSNNINLIISLPIYFKRLEMTKEEHNKYIVKFEIHNDLVYNCKCIVKQESPTYFKRYDSIDNFIINESNENTIFCIPKNKSIDNHNEIFVQVYHDNIGILFDQSLSNISCDNLSISDLQGPIKDTNNKILDYSKSNMEKQHKIFIVHGHETAVVNELENFLIKEFKLDSIILQEKPGSGRTIIEKFEDEAKKATYAFVLLTPDDIVKTKDGKYAQARPNVVFELGWFYGTLGRDKVCIILKEGTEIHSDLSGISQIRFNTSIKEKYWDIQKELKDAKIIE
jgi:predicted nucleotide-binding protein